MWHVQPASLTQPNLMPATAGGGFDDGDEAEAASGREGRWARVATAAMKQCLRPHGLVINPPTSVEQLCQRIAAADAALVGVGPDAPPLHAVAAGLQAPPGQLGSGILCIGPEGVWRLRQVLLHCLASSAAQRTSSAATV